MRHYFFIFCLSLLAILIHGYQFAVSDQEIFIPYILKSVDNSLFPQDLLFQQPSTNLSIFYSIIGFFTRFCNIQIIFFLGYLFFQFLFFCGIYRLAKIIIDNENLAYLSIVPFLLPKFIGGTATSTFELFFGYRLIGIIFLIYYLIALLENKFLRSATIAALGIWVHPLSIIPSLLILPIFIIAKSKNVLKDFFCAMIIFGVILIPFIFVAQHSLLSQTWYIKDELWLSIIKFRNDYLFISTWESRGWLAFGLYLSLSFLFLPKLEGKVKKTILLFIIISLSVFIFNYLILEVFRIPLIAQFQLVRSITPIAYVSLAITPLFLIYKNLLLKTLGIIAFGALSLNLFSVFLFTTAFFILSLIFVEKKTRGTIPAKEIALIIGSIYILHLLLNFNSFRNFQQKIQFPKQTNDWMDLQLWARNHTDKTATFLVPSNQTGFRIFSQRPIIGDIKDGAVVIYSPSFARQWFMVIKDLNNYDNFNEKDILKLKEKYNFHYVVSRSENLFFKLKYENNSFRVYEI